MLQKFEKIPNYINLAVTVKYFFPQQRQVEYKTLCLKRYTLQQLKNIDSTRIYQPSHIKHTDFLAYLTAMQQQNQFLCYFGKFYDPYGQELNWYIPIALIDGSQSYPEILFTVGCNRRLKHEEEARSPESLKWLRQTQPDRYAKWCTGLKILYSDLNFIVQDIERDARSISHQWQYTLPIFKASQHPSGYRGSLALCCQEGVGVTSAALDSALQTASDAEQVFNIAFNALNKMLFQKKESLDLYKTIYNYFKSKYPQESDVQILRKMYYCYSPLSVQIMYPDLWQEIKDTQNLKELLNKYYSLCQSHFIVSCRLIGTYDTLQQVTQSLKSEFNTEELEGIDFSTLIEGGQKICTSKNKLKFNISVGTHKVEGIEIDFNFNKDLGGISQDIFYYSNSLKDTEGHDVSITMRCDYSGYQKKIMYTLAFKMPNITQAQAEEGPFQYSGRGTIQYDPSSGTELPLIAEVNWEQPTQSYSAKPVFENCTLDSYFKCTEKEDLSDEGFIDKILTLKLNGQQLAVVHTAQAQKNKEPVTGACINIKAEEVCTLTTSVIQSQTDDKVKVQYSINWKKGPLAGGSTPSSYIQCTLEQYSKIKPCAFQWAQFIEIECLN